MPLTPNPPALPIGVPIIDEGSKSDLLASAVGGFLNSIAYEETTFGSITAISLPNIPDYAEYCAIIIIANAGTADPTMVANYREDGNGSPTNLASGDSGMPISEKNILTIMGRANMNSFRLISREVLTHTLKVEYFG